MQRLRLYVDAMLALAGLFFAAFLAASLFPAQSETALVTLLVVGSQPVALVLAVATVGNVLGSVLNWALGRFLLRFSDRRWFPVSADRLEKAQRTYARYGRWSLLASWVPIIGDPLTLAAGMMREPLPTFVPIVTLAKGGRYLVLAAAALAWI